MASGILRTAHGAAAEGGALLVAETPVLGEMKPLSVGDTERGLALRASRGRPFQKGNRAGADRGPSLTRITADPSAPEEVRRTNRKAMTLKHQRERELSVQHGGERPSSAVRVEIKAWAEATAWAEVYAREGDIIKATALREKASAFGLKAIAIAEREAAARPRALVDPLAAYMPPGKRDAGGATQ